MPNYDNKSATLRQSSLLRQSTVKFGTDFTQARKFITQALLARLYVFPSLIVYSVQYIVYSIVYSVYCIVYSVYCIV